MRVRKRILLFAVFFFLVILSGVFILEADLSDTRVQQAFIAGTFLAAGWVLTFILREISADIVREQDSIDVQEVYRAEIFDYSEALEDNNSAQIRKTLSAKIKAAGDGKSKYQPFVPKISPPVIFHARAADITLLPEQCIDNVVQFYSMLSDVSTFAIDLMTPEFRQQAATSRAQAFEDYYEMRETCHRIACEALADLGDVKSARNSSRKSLGWIMGVTCHDLG